MPRLIFVNLPVTDLKKSMTFYAALGATNNPQFTDTTSACMVFSDTIHVQLQTHAKWRQFTKRRIPDSHTTAQVMLCISADSREAVEAMNVAAAAEGGVADVNPAQDYGFMLNRSFADPDGHIWEAVWMDPKAAPPQS